MSEHGQQQIKVNFPREMRVTSPEIDSIKVSTQKTLEILTRHLQEIISSVQSVDQLPALIEQLRTTVTENFSTLFTSSVEAEVLSRQAIIKVIENKTEFVQKHIDKKQQHANDAVGVITKDFELYFRQLAEEQEVFLKQLDNHVYDVIENIYQIHVDEYLKSSFPTTQYLTERISNNAKIRTSAISEMLNDAEQEIDSFVDERSACYAALDEHKIDDMQEGSYELPCYFLEVEDRETGETFIQPVLPDLYEYGVNILDDDTRLTIKTAIDEKAESLKGGSVELDLLTEICNALHHNYSIPASEVERFKTDLQTILKGE